MGQDTEQDMWRNIQVWSRISEAILRSILMVPIVLGVLGCLEAGRFATPNFGTYDGVLLFIAFSLAALWVYHLRMIRMAYREQLAYVPMIHLMLQFRKDFLEALGSGVAGIRASEDDLKCLKLFDSLVMKAFREKKFKAARRGLEKWIAFADTLSADFDPST